MKEIVQYATQSPHLYRGCHPETCYCTEECLIVVRYAGKDYWSWHGSGSTEYCEQYVREKNKELGC